MKKRGCLKAAWCCLLLLSGVCLGGEIEYVTIGDPGNAPFLDYSVDWSTGSPQQIVREGGAVPYVFRLGKYELTQGQYLEFLNKADPQGGNPYKLFCTKTTAFPPYETGIDYVLDPSKPEGQRYALANGGADLPAWGITWYSAARFCNWLHNGKGGPGSTEGDATRGAYDTRNFDDGDPANDPPTHNPGAKFWIPTFNEWFKAAYYRGGGTNAGYRGYYDGPHCTGEPYGGLPTTDSRYANFYPRSSRQNPLPPNPKRRVPVGSYPNSKSAYGCLDMAGNGNEWSEKSEIYFQGQPARRTMGGGWWWFTDHASPYAQFNFSTHTSPTDTWWNGLRVAALPAAVNSPPTISNISDQSTPEDTSTAAIPFTIGDLETAATALTVVCSSDNQSLLPNANLVLGGSGASRTVSARPAANRFGTTTITVTVTDAGGLSASDSFLLTVAAVNDAPSANSQAVTTPEDTAKTLTLTGSDVEGSALTFTIVSQPAHGTLSGSGASRTYTPAANYSGADSFTFTVNDGALDSNTATVSITVTALNDTPVLVSGPTATPNPAAPGQAVVFAVSAVDVDGDTLSYAWNFGDGTAGSSASPSHAYAAIGSYTAVVTVSDGKGGTATGSVTVSVRDSSPPSLAVTTAVLRGTALDAEGAVTVTVNGSTATVAADGTWSKEVVLNNGSNIFTIRAVDPSGNATSQTITVAK